VPAAGGAPSSNLLALVHTFAAASDSAYLWRTPCSAEVASGFDQPQLARSELEVEYASQLKARVPPDLGRQAAYPGYAKEEVSPDRDGLKAVGHEAGRRQIDEPNVNVTLALLKEAGREANIGTNEERTAPLANAVHSYLPRLLASAK
jgi:hypothetical protein